MFSVPDKCKTKNVFKQVHPETPRELYEKLGERAPQKVKAGGVAMFGLSKIQQIALGQALEAEKEAEEARKQAEVTQPIVSPTAPVEQPKNDENA